MAFAANRETTMCELVISLIWHLCSVSLCEPLVIRTWGRGIKPFLAQIRLLTKYSVLGAIGDAHATPLRALPLM